jgi:hypothetical protein
MSVSITRRRAHIGRYGLWQLRDYLMDGAAKALVLCLALGYGQVFPILKMAETQSQHLRPQDIARYGSVEAARQAVLHTAVQSFATSFIGTVAFLGALMAINGIVLNDRRMGYYRFLFAKPIRPIRYYTQAFAISVAGFALVSVVLGLVFGALVAPVLTMPVLGVVVLMYFFYASIGFLFSAATRIDWLALIVTSIASQLLWTVYGNSTSIFAKLLYLVPPLTKTGEIYSAAVTGSAMPWNTVGWFAGYAAVCFSAALVVLHRRRLAVS